MFSLTDIVKFDLLLLRRRPIYQLYLSGIYSYIQVYIYIYIYIYIYSDIFRAYERKTFFYKLFTNSILLLVYQWLLTTICRLCVTRSKIHMVHAAKSLVSHFLPFAQITSCKNRFLLFAKTNRYLLQIILNCSASFKPMSLNRI